MTGLTPPMQKFITHWGEMGAKWGINRTVAQIHALLYISPKPLNADDFISLLKVARSNVSSSLRELQNWRIVKVVHILGDRRDHYECMKDICEMFQTILDDLLTFFDTTSQWYERVRKMPMDKIMSFVQLEKKFSKFFKK